MAPVPAPPGGGTKILAYLASFFFAPIVGLILFFVWRTSASPEYQALGRTSLIISLVATVLACICYLLLFVLGIGAGVLSS